MDFFESNMPTPLQNVAPPQKTWKAEKIVKKYYFSVATPQILIDFPLKLPFLKIFEIIVESSLTAHSIGKILNNIKKAPLDSP